MERFRHLEEKKLPQNVDYLGIKGLSIEAAQKLERHKPGCVGQALRISGVSPADVNVLLAWLKAGHLGDNPGA